MAAPTVASYTTYEGTSETTSADFVKPTGVTSGDFLVLIVGNDDSNSTDPAINTPTGWTQQYQAGDNVVDNRHCIFTRVADGTEGTTTTVTMNGTADYWTGFYLRITGADDTTFQIGTGVVDTDNGTTVDIPALTTSNNDSLVIASVTLDGSDGGTATASGTGWSNTVVTARDTSLASTGVSTAWTYKELATAGTSSTCTFTWGTGDGNTGVQFAIGPASGSLALTLPHISSGASIHAPTVAPGSVAVTLPHIANTASIHEMSLAASYDLTLPHIDSTASLHEPTVAPGAVAVTLPEIASGSSLFVPTLTPTGGTQAVTLPAISSTASLHLPTVEQTVVLPHIDSTESLLAPSVAPGAVAVVLPAITGGSTLFAPSVEAEVIVELPHIAGAATLSAMTVAPGSVNVGLPVLSETVLSPPSVAGGATTSVTNQVPADRRRVILSGLDRDERRLALKEKDRQAVWG